MIRRFRGAPWSTEDASHNTCLDIPISQLSRLSGLAREKYSLYRLLLCLYAWIDQVSEIYNHASAELLKYNWVSTTYRFQYTRHWSLYWIYESLIDPIHITTLSLYTQYKIPCNLTELHVVSAIKLKGNFQLVTYQTKHRSISRNSLISTPSEFMPLYRPQKITPSVLRDHHKSAPPLQKRKVTRNCISHEFNSG